MMNRSIKIILVVGVFGIVFLTHPFSAQALLLNPNLIQLIQPPKLPPAVAKNTEAFCANFSVTANDLSSNFANRRDKLNVWLDKQSENTDNHRNARDAKLEELRSKADQRRSEWYARLEDKAKTDAEKDAVVKFKQTLEQAVDDRRTAVDGAIADFRKGVDVLLVTRTTNIQTNRDAFRTALNAALDQVTSDCDKGLSTVQIRKNFRDNLKAARTKLKTDQQNETKVRGEVHALALARAAAIKKAIANFDATFSSAVSDLKKAFNE